MQNCVDTRWYTLILVDKLADWIGRQVNALHYAVQRAIGNDRGLAISNSRRKYSAFYLPFQRAFSENLTITKMRAVE